MEKMKLHGIVGLGGFGVALAACVVQANTIGPFDTTTPIPFTPIEWAGSLSFPQFDTSLGTLSSVTLDLSGSLGTTVSVTNVDSLRGSTGSASTEVELSVQDSGVHLIVPELDLFSPAYSYTLVAGGNTSSGQLISSGTSDNTYTSASVLSEFSGAGTISLSASTFTQTLLANAGGNTYASQASDAALTGSVTYNYTPSSLPTPEPSLAALLGIGMAGMFGYAMRRRRIVERMSGDG